MLRDSYAPATVQLPFTDSLGLAGLRSVLSTAFLLCVISVIVGYRYGVVRTKAQLMKGSKKPEKHKTVRPSSNDPIRQYTSAACTAALWWWCPQAMSRTAVSRSEATHFEQLRPPLALPAATGNQAIAGANTPKLLTGPVGGQGVAGWGLSISEGAKTAGFTVWKCSFGPGGPPTGCC